ncbi:hypothetical protein BD289DRAFT_425998 [Coniella lustricola]|uniref:Uncharacterized protein n=1 Tax=Coniella lustricola TaxID=2025994 RepID=A0A2T3AGV7_9PEZI|nr:hypothetical protein BD289DRAFT_425998 [Coniella lustricola]
MTRPRAPSPDPPSFSLDNPVIKRSPPGAVIYDLSEPDQVTITLPTGSTWSSSLHWHEHHIEYLRVVKGSISVTLNDEKFTLSAESSPAATSPEIRIDRNSWHEWRRADAAEPGVNSNDSDRNANSNDDDENDSANFIKNRANNDANSGTDHDEVVVIERTEPADTQKTVFFWNLNGVLLKAQRLSLARPPFIPQFVHAALVDLWVTLSLFVIFRDLDNVPVFVNVLQAFATRGFTFVRGTLGDVLLRHMDRLISHLVLFVVSRIAWLFGIRAVRAEYTPRDVYTRWAGGAVEGGKAKET